MQAVKRRFRASDVFSPALYWQGMKRLSLVGILGLVTVVLPLLITLISAVILRDFFGDTFIGIPAAPTVLFAITAELQLPIYAAITAITAFSFLNKRSASDHYHVIPLSLEEVFVYEMEALGYTFDDQPKGASK